MKNSFERFFGEHTFSGCKIDTVTIYDEGWCCERDCTVCLFSLDGETYQLLEDRTDSYRSYCENIEISNKKIRPEFSIRVVCTPYDDEQDATQDNDCMRVIDIKNGKTVLVVGTKNTDDYYPYCCFDYRPQNISLNEQRRSN